MAIFKRTGKGDVSDDNPTDFSNTLIQTSAETSSMYVM